MKKFIHTNIDSFLNESIVTDKILDKIHKTGQSSLTYDERRYLSGEYADKDFENYLLIGDEYEKDYDLYVKDYKSRYGVEPIYDEYVYGSDEDIFADTNKTIRCIDKILNRKGSVSREFGGEHVWKIKSGIYLFFDNQELVLIDRKTVDDEYVDNTLFTVRDIKSFYGLFDYIKTII